MKNVLDLQSVCCYITLFLRAVKCFKNFVFNIYANKSIFLDDTLASQIPKNIRKNIRLYELSRNHSSHSNLKMS